MPDSTVSSCVLNILGSFSNSLSLYKKLRQQKLNSNKKRWCTRRKAPAAAVDENVRLLKSLRSGTEHISYEYQRSVSTFGDAFAVGDAIAQTTLAEVLLQLNVGLIGIITSFLHSESNDILLDHQGLTNLSDRSRIDTCNILRQLCKRLTYLRASRRHQRKPKNSALSASREKHVASHQQQKLRGATLAQVVIQDSSKAPQLALVRPGERRKKSSSDSALSKSTSTTKLSSASCSTLPAYTPRQSPETGAKRPRRKQSEASLTKTSANKRADKLRATKSTPRLQATLHEPFNPVPAVPAIDPALLPGATFAPLLQVPRHRKPTPTFYSIATDSTKIGEIPLHKWAEQADFDQMSLLNQQAHENGWPNEAATQSRKRAGIFSLFRRRSS